VPGTLLYNRLLPMETILRHRAFVILVSLFCSASAFAAEEELPEKLKDVPEVAQAQAAYQRGVAALQQGQVDLALTEASAAATLFEAAQGPDSIYVCSALDLKANALLYKPGGYANALPLAQRCLAVREKILGPHHPYVAMSLESVAACSMGTQRWDDATAALERVSALYQKLGGEGDARRVAALGHLADAYQMGGKKDRADQARARQKAAQEGKVFLPSTARELALLGEGMLSRGEPCQALMPVYTRLQAMLDKQKKENQDLALALDVQASCLERDAATLPKALEAMRRAAALYARVLKETDPAVLKAMEKYARLAEASNLVEEAVVLRGKVLDLNTKLFGADSLPVAMAAARLGTLHKDRGALAQAVPFIQRARTILEKRGEDVLGQARLLSTEGELRREMGDYAVAAPLYLEALKRLETLPPNDTVADRASVLQNQALLLKQTGVLDQAEKQYLQVIAMEEQALGADALELSYPLNNLAELLRDQARFPEAAPLYERCLNIRLKHVGHDHPLTATVLQNKALLAWDQRNEEEAAALFDEAIAAYEASVPADHPLLNNTRRNLAVMLRLRGDWPQAEALLQRALDVELKSLGPDHPWIAVSRTQLGLLYMEWNHLDRARSHLEAAYQQRLTRLGKDHPDTLVSAVNLAEVERLEGNTSKADALIAAAQAGLEKTYGKQHPVVATCIQNRAVMKADVGDLKGAEPGLRQALALREKALGPDHPDTADTLYNLAHVVLLQGGTDEAATLLQSWSDRRERHNQRALGAGSEQEKVRAGLLINQELYRLATLHGARGRANAPFTNVLATHLLRNKGRALDAMADVLAALRTRLEPGDRALLDLLTALKSRYAGNPVSAQKDGLDAKIDAVERALAARSAQFRAAATQVDVASIQRAMPKDSALLEYLEFSPAMDGTWDQRHLAAVVVLPQGDPVWVDLGEAKSILADVEAMRSTLAQADHPDAHGVSSALHARLLAPLLPHAPNATLLLVAPIVELLTVPWASLTNAEGAVLMETRAVVVLGSGRDVLRINLDAATAGPSVVVANPDFGSARQPVAGETRSRARGLRDLEGVEFVPLPGTAQEAKAVAPLLKDARTLTGKSATEDAFKKMVAPRVLHVATHGFFLQSNDPPTVPQTRGSRGLKLKAGGFQQPQPPPTDRFMDAWLRSGLALSNANGQPSSTNDGVVTGLELSAMNLWGTRLVVLSACETGLGKAYSASDAVLGLRRALVLAGAQSQVVSLWNVDDDATRDLMVAFYKNLSKGLGRAESLRQAQLTLRKNPKYSHPYYWSAFTFGGDWRPLK
jgi:CHAT domain-containing protein